MTTTTKRQRAPRILMHGARWCEIVLGLVITCGLIVLMLRALIALSRHLENSRRW